MTRDEKVALLGTVPLFAGAESASLEALADACGEVEFHADQYLATQGQVGTGLFIVATGGVRVERGGDVLARLGPGEFAGELSVLDQQPRMASLVADGPTTCLALASWDLIRILEADCALGLTMLRGLAGRLRRVAIEAAD